MTNALEELKKRRKAALEKIQSKVQTKQPKKSYKDDRMWKPSVDPSGNGFALIRFLPAKNPDLMPWAHYYDHFFQGPTGKWYVEYSLSTWNKPCPVYESTKSLWELAKGGDELAKSTARARGRKCHYISNILVIKDPLHPENEGKTFLYDYGIKIHEKLTYVMGIPAETGEEGVYDYEDDREEYNPFDLWDGADFKIRICTIKSDKNGWRNYDKSDFSKQAPLFGGDDTKLSEILEKVVDLEEFTSQEKNGKTYEELEKKLNQVLGESSQEIERAPIASAEDIKTEPEKEISSLEAESEDSEEGFDYKALFSDDE